MRLKPNQSRLVAGKIVKDLINAPFIKLLKDKESVMDAVEKIIKEHLEQERALDNKVKEIIEEHYEDIEMQQADERQLFFMIKKRLAPEFGIIMNYDDRYSDLSHKILDELYEEYLIDYEVNDNQVKNVIFKAFKDYISSYDEIDDIVYEKIKNMKKDLVPGSLEYEILYERLFKEELIRRGFI
ncbi:MAG: DUF507 family protein [Epsilonproteobacteria bacterium]|nr:DUF507 family protein [Campylobacterota bacterium]